MPQRYIPALDGVRGVAILCVVIYHVMRKVPYSHWHEEQIHRLAMGGWVGVDLFFVLSGFLITGILLDSKGAPGYFRTFYTRRVLRILPLYLFLVAVIFWVVPFVHLATPSEVARMRDAEPWYWTHMVNVLIARSDWGGALWLTSHLWSLSLEEQFYLVWPALVFLLSRRALIRATGVLIVVAAGLRVLLVMQDVSSTAIYVLLPTRMDSLAMGALLAALMREPGAWERVRRWMWPAATVAGLVILVIAYQQYELRAQGRLTQIFGYPALAVLSASLLVTATTAVPGSWQARVWTLPALRFLGKYSYGLYVWHQVATPLLRLYVLPDSQLPTFAGSLVPGYAVWIALTLTVSLMAALASWKLIEEPFLRLKRFVPYGDNRRRVVLAREIVPGGRAA